MKHRPWSGVDLRHLAALAAIAREGSFRAAADSLGYVQSAVSEQIAHLERAVDARLVERRRGAAPVALTQAGELLLHHVEEILARLSAAQSDLEALHEGRAGRLRIGVYESVATRLMPRILSAFAHRMPSVKVEMVESGSGEALAELVGAGELDAAFSGLPLPAGPFEYRKLARDPYVLLVPATWPLATTSVPPSQEQLGELELIGHTQGRVQGVLEDRLRAHGISPNVVIRADLNATVQALVGAGIGAALVPRLAVDESDDRTVALELDGVLPPRVIALYWQAERRPAPALDSFVELAALVSLDVVSDSRRSLSQPPAHAPV